MFLHELSREQQQAFPVLVRQVIAADERLAMQEVECLAAIYREMGLQPQTAEAPDVALDLNFLFDTPRSRAVVFIELLLVGYADGVFDDQENEAIVGFADAMAIPTETRKDAYNWARRLVDMRREGEEIGTA